MVLHKACGGIAGIGAPGALGFLIAALQGGDNANLLWLGAAVCGVVALGGIGGWLLTRDSDLEPRQSSTGSQSPNIYTHGEHSPVNVNINAPPPLTMHWLDRPGGPQFRLRPGIENRETPSLLCEIYITDANPMPGGLQARWIHPSIEMDWTTPMRANTSMRGARKFQMKPIEVTPTPPEDSVTFEVKFNLEDGEHGGRCTCPGGQHDQKGHWITEQHLGSHIFQPRREDAW